MCANIWEKKTELERFCSPILNKPKPQPKPEEKKEPKPEEKKESKPEENNKEPKPEENKTEVKMDLD